MTAPVDHVQADVSGQGATPGGESAIEIVARLCKSAIGGRRAARALAVWTKPFELSDAEFQVLWQLRSAPAHGLDQTTLAERLAFSPAQVSATVERLRARRLIVHQAAAGDRRRRHWQLSAGGRKLIDQMLFAAGRLRSAALGEVESATAARAREAAA